jgi:hypothetical protein
MGARVIGDQPSARTPGSYALFLIFIFALQYILMKARN